MTWRALAALFRRRSSVERSSPILSDDEAETRRRQRDRETRDQEMADIRRAMAEDRDRLMRLQVEADVPTIRRRRRREDE